jgi:hypothetical protein
MSDKIDLAPEQKQSILDFWNQHKDNPPAVQEIVNHLWPNESYDHRSLQYKAVTAFLASRRLKPKSRSEAIEISEAHKQYIKNNSPAMNAQEMARVIFANPQLSNLSAETRAINEYLKSIQDSQEVSPDVEDVPMGKYEPPDTLFKALKKVNEYTSLGWKLEEIKPYDKKGIEALIKYLSTNRFVKDMNAFPTNEERKSFEDAFIRYTFDKPDLTWEQVDQYINLSEEVVLAFRAQRRSEKLQTMLDRITDQADGSNESRVRLGMDLAEMIGKIQTEYNLSRKRQQDLLDDLTEKRSEMLGKKITENASVLNLVQEWRMEEDRKKWLTLAEKEDRAVNSEIEKIKNMPEIKGRMIGLTEKEAKYG